MKALLDTNVVLDIVLERQPFVEQAIRLLEAAQHANIVLYLTATTITDLYYIARRAKGRTTALEFISDLMRFMEVAGVDKAVIKEALDSDMADFEDAVQTSAARKQAIRVIVTRNQPDFVNSALEIHNPESFIEMMRTAHLG